MKLINLPNIITCCNLLCGSMAIYFGMHGRLDIASCSIIGGAVFDFFDGLTARALHISGPIGKELDSLADMVTFGVAPSVLAYCTLTLVISGQTADCIAANNSWFFLGAMLMAAFSALRLAKFNCDERQSLSFIGLPTPANALFWIGLCALVQIPVVREACAGLSWWAVVLWAVLLLGLSILLISEVPMFSLKIKPGHMGLSENLTRYVFILLAAIVLIAALLTGCLLASFAPIILMYILFSIFNNR